MSSPSVVSAPFTTEASKMCGWKGKKTLLKQLEPMPYMCREGAYERSPGGKP